jgi:methyltransferase (TIGR00027 family)
MQSENAGATAIVANVSDTARWAAAYRAMESARPDALFRDPLAERLAGAMGMAMAGRTPLPARNGWPIILRTKVIDDWILQAVAAGCDGVLNLAAGLDTRPYRLPLPAFLDWIEVDLPAMIEEKSRALADAVPLCLMTRRAVDLSDASARKDLLDDVLSRHGRLLVITEGLLMYLDDASAGSLARDLCRPSVEGWIFDILSPAVRSDIMRGMKRELKQAPMQFAPSDGVAFFERLGWTVLEVRSALQEAYRAKRLPMLLHLLASLPLPVPDPRNLGRARWSGIVRLGRRA